LKASDQQAGFVDFCGMLVYEPIGYTLCQSTFGEYNHLFLITKPIVVMKPIYLLLLVLMACGFFACTTDYATDSTEIAPQPEGKIMDAATFASFTTDLEEFGLFDKEVMTDDDFHGVEDFRIYLVEDGTTFDCLTDSDISDEDRTIEEIMDLRPVRNWSSSITLTYSKGDAERFQNWLTDNFSGSDYVDLRLSFLENNEMLISGLKPTEADLEQFPDVPLFNL